MVTEKRRKNSFYKLFKDLKSTEINKRKISMMAETKNVKGSNEWKSILSTENKPWIFFNWKTVAMKVLQERILPWEINGTRIISIVVWESQLTKCVKTILGWTVTKKKITSSACWKEKKWGNILGHWIFCWIELLLLPGLLIGVTTSWGIEQGPFLLGTMAHGPI